MMAHQVPTMKLTPFPIFALAALLLAGCQTAYRFSVDAINSPTTRTGQSYVLLPGDPETSVNDLRFQEAAKYAQAALATKGYTRVPEPSQADVVITLDAAVGEPQTLTRTSVEPLYMETGGYYRQVSRPIRDKEGNVRYVTSTIWSPPRNRLVGTYDSSESYLVYEKRFALTAFTNEGADVEKLPQLWSVVVSNQDSSSDLRAYLPLLATVAADYIDADTGKQVTVKLKADDPRVLQVHGGTGRSDSL